MVSNAEAAALSKFTPTKQAGGCRQWLHENGRLYIQMTTERGHRTYEICERNPPVVSLRQRWFTRSLGAAALKIERYLNDEARDALAKSAGLTRPHDHLSYANETAYGVFP